MTRFERSYRLRTLLRGVATFAVLATVLLCLSPAAQSQYFGRNKVLWDRFDFRIMETEHFDIHYYPADAEHAEYVARLVERWYVRLSHWFDHDFEERRPLIIYRDHADFQQTVITPGLIGEGTGGFAESLRDRMVLPLTGVNADNDHVIGHELVHAFQFDIMRSGAQGEGMRRGAQVPLWVMEGLAEYLSEGRHDPATAIVLRDAVLHDALPEQRGLFRRQLSPYHYGQAIWAYIAGRWSDETARAFFVHAIRQGVDSAYERVLGMSSRDFFEEFHQALGETYQPVLDERQAASEVGERLLHADTTGASINLAPALSPNGQWVAFLSTRELDLDLFLADARTGRVERRLVSAEGSAHFDNLSFLDSSVGWSPDSRWLAFAVFSRGERRIAIYDMERRRIERLLHIDGIKGMRHPTWTPDGRFIVFSAQTNGASDLYLFDLESDEVRRLTEDGYDALQPRVSPDGRHVVFVTDRGPATDLGLLHFGPSQLALLDMETGAIRELPIFSHGKHIDPHFSEDGESLFFVAEPDGVPDLYRYRLSDGSVSRLTRLKTGVQGITSNSPAMSAADGAVVYSVLENSRWSVYALRDLEGEPVVAANLTPTTAGILPPMPPEPDPSLVEEYLAAPAAGLLPAAAPRQRFPVREYMPRFGLSNIGPATIGVGADTVGGMGLEGAVSLFFSDPLNQHELITSFQGGATQGVLGLEDMLGADAIYLNQTRRLQWGARVHHLPFLRTGSIISRETVDVDGRLLPADVLQRLYDVQRVSGVAMLAQYPFSMNDRVETSVGFTRVSFSREVERLVFPAGAPAFRETVSLPTPPSISIQTVATAFVRDTSRFGFVSPLRGTRMRVEAELATGDLRFQTARLDYRRYFFRNPVTFAVRAMHVGRRGTDAEDPRLPVLDVGRADLVRGYELGTFSAEECTMAAGMSSCPEFDRLIGSRIAVANLELRVPLFGTEEFGIFNVPVLPTEALVFIDAGAAWRSGQSVDWSFERDTIARVPVVSTGVAIRTVLLGALPLEAYYAYPYQRPRENSVFGVRIGIGW